MLELRFSLVGRAVSIALVVLTAKEAKTLDLINHDARSHSVTIAPEPISWPTELRAGGSAEISCDVCHVKVEGIGERDVERGTAVRIELEALRVERTESAGLKVVNATTTAHAVTLSGHLKEWSREVAPNEVVRDICHACTIKLGEAGSARGADGSIEIRDGRLELVVD